MTKPSTIKQAGCEKDIMVKKAVAKHCLWIIKSQHPELLAQELKRERGVIAERIEDCRTLLRCYSCGEHKKLDLKISRILDYLKQKDK